MRSYQAWNIRVILKNTRKLVEKNTCLPVLSPQAEGVILWA